jgi:hypothetical protein
MNQENLNTLKERVKNTGFTVESLENELKEKMESQEPKFRIKYPQKVGNDEVEATLNFRKSDQNDNYYFNNYEVAVKAENSTAAAVTQTFYVGKDNNYTLDEAYNLLSHRFVNKDLVNQVGENYNAWTKLDFKETEANGNYKMKYFGEKWGYDLEKALAKYPAIKELVNEADKTKLMESLKKGNRQEVTLVQDGLEKVGYVVANAYGRSVSVTDENLNRVRMSKAEGQSEGKGKKENQKENATDDSTKKNQKNSKRHGQHV